jgi:AraC family transcriptional regulator of adaptative response/methylated-DNA-[protein]-cysteine methyltransferase
MDILRDSRWEAVQRRDDSDAHAFVYAVRSTGVYCKPGCASRQPLRHNVEFFDTPEEAARAGYRACRRCRPDQGHVEDPSHSAVVALCRRLEQSDEIDLRRFAADVGYSERHLRRRFAEIVGVPVASYVRGQRALRVRPALQSKVAVTQAIVDAGYRSSRAFYEDAAPRLGMTPSTYRRGGNGERISYTSLRTPLGVILAASTSRGVCAVRIGNDETALEKELSQEFPCAMIERDDEGLVELAQVLTGAIHGGSAATSLPIDLVGTAFQMRVWEVLRDVPAGTTLSYSQVAQRLGTPRAARAVGSACAANPAALVVPCHRVVRSDGSLGGYRWGLDVKSALLDAEGSSLRH